MTSPDTPTPPEPLPPDTPAPKRSRRQKLFALFAVAAILAGGWFISQQLLEAGPTAKRRQAMPLKTVVKLLSVQAAPAAIDLEAMGTVTAARRLELKPQVSGRVIEVSPRLMPGSRLQSGEVVLKIDPRDYELALERSRNDLRRAAMDLRLEQGSQAIARREFELIREYTNTSVKDAPEDLVLRKPQLAKAKAAEAAARTSVEQAELNLQRTVLKSPFNAVVLETGVTVGAELSPRTTVATLAGTDTFWIRLTVPRDDLADLVLPDDEDRNIAVTVLSIPETRGVKWQGTLVRLLPDVDPQGLMARLLVTVDKPLEQNPDAPLLLGSMVKVLLPGRTIKACYTIPRTAVRPDHTVLLADKENRLAIRPVTVLRTNRDLAYITAGLADGDRLVISALGAPIAGMPLTPADTERPGKQQGNRSR
jgi:RND family efflux transporter MFP subunit